MPEYQSLYRKYRSQTFADLVGQDAASRALQGAIISSRVAHAYLFSGSRGTGKTSAARLLAKALNCTGRARDSAEPCNRCQSCVEMTAGSALDLIEIDAASNRGIDEIRDLREKVNLAPALGPYKVYIIDEAHMLTEPAFNALLKTLEEPPAHVVFVLCTTDAQKIPLTVIGRCQQFVFRRHSEEQIVGRLTHIAKTEKVQVDAAAMELIARTAQGSMRDAVGLLDQLVPLAADSISLESARSLLGIADPRVLDALLHLDGEVRRHAEPRFLVEATLARLAVEAGTVIEQVSTSPPALRAPSPQGGEVNAPPPVLRAASPQGGEVTSPPTTVQSVSGWSEVLEKLNRTVRAAYLDAQPEVDGSVLVLWFRYGFHHKKAQEQSAQLIPHVRAWLGDDVKIDFRLREAESPKGPPRSASPEDDPFVREIVRRFDGRVTRVKEVSE